MSLVSRLRAGVERRTTFADPAQWLTQAFTGGATHSGKSATPKTALGLAPYWRGVNLLAGLVGGMPLKVYRPTTGVPELVGRKTNPWRLLHDTPNTTRLLAANEFWSIVESHLDTWGNSFAWKERGGDGRVANLWPQDPSRWAVGTAKDGSRRYVLDGDFDDPYTDFDILHFRALSLDGIVGYSPVQVHRQTLGSEMARQEYGGRFWANDATPGVVLVHPQKINPEAIDRIKAKWDIHHKGSSNARRTAVLGENIAIHQMSMPMDDAQYVEQAQLSATDQALILGLPPEKVGGKSGGSMTYNTMEMAALALLQESLSPRLVRIQQAVTYDPDIMPETWFAKFDSGGMLRSTTKERYDAWAVAPHLLVDEMREMDDREPLPNGAGQVLAKSVTISQAAPSDGAEGDQENDDEAAALRAAERSAQSGL